MKFESDSPNRTTVPVWKIVSYALGIVFTSFILAHYVGQGLTREGEPAGSKITVEGKSEVMKKPSKGEP